MDEELIDYLIDEGEAVEYGERWTENTTHEWWRDADGKRHCRLVQTYHGGGSRGDDDEAEYAQRLLDTGRAVHEGDADTEDLPREVTHLIGADGKAKRFRYYVAPPEVE